MGSSSSISDAEAEANEDKHLGKIAAKVDAAGAARDKGDKTVSAVVQSLQDKASK